MDGNANRLFNLQTYADAQRKRLRESMEEEGMIQVKHLPHLQQQQSRMPAPTPQRHGLMHLRQATTHHAGFSGHSDRENSDVPVVATGPSFFQNLFPNMRERARVSAVELNLIRDSTMDDAQRDATIILQSNLHTENNAAVNLDRMLGVFDKAFRPFQLSGTFNTDQNEEPIQGTTSVTFTKEFLLSMKRNDQFVMLPLLGYISWDCFLHLCRSPVFFCIDTEILEKFLIHMQFFPVNDPDQESDEYSVFAEWYRSIGRAKFMMQKKDFCTLYNMFGCAELVRRAVMNLRSLFLTRGTTQDSRRQQDLYEFFNMEYQPWRHGFFEFFRKYINPTGSLSGYIIPFSSVEHMVSEYATKTNTERAAEEDAKIEAQRLDLFYANLVHGAAVRVNMSEVWAPDQVGVCTQVST